VIWVIVGNPEIGRFAIILLFYFRFLVIRRIHFLVVSIHEV